MRSGDLTRRAALLLPVLLAACASEEEPAGSFPPLRYNYLPPIQMNVESIDVQQRFVPAGVAPDVSLLDPVPPVQALTAMAKDRLQAFGTSNKAIFAITDASLTRENDIINGSFAVSLSVFDDSGAQQGFANARVEKRHTGRIGNIRSVLYDMTKDMMSDMNVEFEYQVRRNLRAFLTGPAAPDNSVQQAPLDQSGPGQSAPGQSAPNQPQPTQLQPGSDQPTQLQPGQPGQPQPSQLQSPQPGQLQPPQPNAVQPPRSQLDPAAPDPYPLGQARPYQPQPYQSQPDPYSSAPE